MREGSLDTLISALCLDYGRRKSLIEGRTCPRRVDTELRYYNFKLYEAAAEIVGEELAEVFIYEIGARIGYAGSEVEGMCERTYKTYKRRVKDNMALRLYLGEQGDGRGGE